MLVLATWRSLLDRMGCAAGVPTLFETLSSDRAAIVVGARLLRRKGYQSAWVRRFRIAILTVFSALVGTRVTDPTSGDWGLNRHVVDLLARDQPDDYPETQPLMLATRAALRIAEIPMVMLARKAGQSSIAGTLGSGFYRMKLIFAVLIERPRQR